MRQIPRTLAALAVTAAALVAPDRAAAQDPTNFSTWLRGEIKRILADERVIAANGNGVANQNESPSTDQTSTSLVDTSSASDFVSLALNLTGLRPPTDDESTPTSGSVTASLYSLVAGVKGVALTDPAFYKRGTPLRRLSITIGSEESTVEDHFTDKPATNLGAKLLILNNRDVYSGHARRQLDAMDAGVDAFVAEQQQAINEIQCLIFRAVQPGANPKLACTADPAFAPFLKTIPFGPENWPKTLKALEAKPEAMREVVQVVTALAAGHKTASETVAAAVEQIQRGRQLAFAYYTKQREDDGTDEHRAEVIFDYGLSTRLNWTLNASFDYRDRKTTDDMRSGRFATEFQAKLSNPGTRVWAARPVVLSGGLEGSKETDVDWLIRAQAKVVIPITTGVDVPIAYSYANRDDEGIESGSRLKFSLAVDPVRLRERFR
jgi:hypothetical protein